MSYHVIGTCVHYYITITDIALLFGKMLPLDLTVKATLNAFVLHMVIFFLVYNIMLLKFYFE